MKRSLLFVAALSLSAGPALSTEVTHLSADAVSRAFAEGAPLVELENYKIHASRREAPGKAEIHVRDTDVIYVLDGEATFVTGGTAVDTEEVAPEEIRGRSIADGETRTLRKGDVIVVPNGTPHWFESVKAPFLYYVVKVQAPR